MAKMADDTKVTRAYAGGDSNVAKSAREGNNGFKRGGMAKKDVGSVMGGAAKMRGDRKPRQSGGGVFSSASSGKPRSPSSHY